MHWGDSKQWVKALFKMGEIVKFSKMLFLWTKTGSNQFIYHSYMHSIPQYMINFKKKSKKF